MSTQTQEELTPTDELYHIQESTNDDGTVDVEIVEWSKEGDVVYVEYRTPTMETVTESMQWPQKDSSDYKFVRLVRHCGFDLHGADQIEECTVKFESGVAIVPEQKTRRERITEKISLSGWWVDKEHMSIEFVVFVVFWWASGLLALLFHSDGRHNDDYMRGQVSIWLGVMVYTTVGLVWYFF